MSFALLRAGILAASALAVTPALAQDQIGSDVADAGALAALCSGPDLAFCYGYITGAAQFYEAIVTDPELDIEPFVCPNGPVAREAARATFLDWRAANPGGSGEGAIHGLFRSWAAAFPCS